MNHHVFSYMLRTQAHYILLLYPSKINNCSCNTVTDMKNMGTSTKYMHMYNTYQYITNMECDDFNKYGK